MADESEGPDQGPPEEPSPQARGPRLTILSNLPDTLPVIGGEVALIHAYLSELVARLAANDNGGES